MTTTDLHTRLTAAITARLDVARAAQADPQTYAIPARGINPVRDHYALWDPTTAIRVLEALQEEIGEHYRTVEDDLREVCWECSSSPYPESRLWPCRPVRRWCRALGVEVE